MSCPLDSGPGRADAVRRMFDRIAPRYQTVNRLLTFGLDAGWRRRAVAGLGLAPGATVVDVGCGPGDFCGELEAAGYRAVGADLSLGMLRAGSWSGPRVQADALRLPFRDGGADGVTCGFVVRNVTSAEALLAEMARIVRPGAPVALMEVAEPQWAPARLVHRTYFHRVVPALGGILSDRQAYRYLPDSTVYLPSPVELHRMMAEAGWVDVRRQALGLGAAQLFTARRA